MSEERRQWAEVFSNPLPEPCDGASHVVVLGEHGAGRCACGMVTRPGKPRKTPQEWAADRGMQILDPDGWRKPDSPPFDQPCTEDEFVERFWQCTVGPLDWGRR